MKRITRRSFVARGAAAALTGFLAPGWLGELAFGAPPPTPYTRYNVNTQQGQAMLGKLNTAVGIMMGSPVTSVDCPAPGDWPAFTNSYKGQYDPCDPRSYIFQWFEHWTCYYQATQYSDSTTYKEDFINNICKGDTTLAGKMWNACQAHGIDPNDPTHFEEWFFPPWHRMYLFYFEQMVREVLSDPSFTVPYWDPASGEVADLSIPEAFRDQTNYPFLYDDRYSAVNQGVRIDNVVVGPGWLNRNALREKFYIDSPTGSYGFCTQVDINPHFLVHVTLGGDMAGGFNTAAKDPIFWVHHCNIDRYWESWNRRGGQNPKQSAWLNRAFTFADPNGNPIEVPVSAVTRVAKLGYQYDSYAKPPKGLHGYTGAAMDASGASVTPRIIVATAPTGGPILGPGGALAYALPPATVAGGKPASPLARRLEALAHGKQLYLVLKGLRAKTKTNVAYAVYLDLPTGAAPRGASDPHFVGGLAFMNGHFHGAQRAFNITETVEKLAAHSALGARQHAVTIIPNSAAAAHAQPIIDQISLVEI